MNCPNCADGTKTDCDGRKPNFKKQTDFAF